ncbi:DndE family protein, partial [Oleiphilus sp. HI0117]
LDDQKTNGSLALSKSIWFGDYESLIETLLRDHYPDLDDESLVKAWASHVKHGESYLSNLA